MRKTSIASGKASAISRPIPASREPCPGKQKAMGPLISIPPVRRPFDQTRPPREARAHTGHEHERALLKAPLRLRVRQSERNRAGRRVSVTFDVDHDFLLRNPQLLGGWVADPD